MEQIPQNPEEIPLVPPGAEEVDRVTEEQIVIQSIDRQDIILDSQVFTTMMSCPRKGDFRFNHNFEGLHGKAKSLQKGSACHENLEAFYKAVIQGVIRKEAIGYGTIAMENYFLSSEWNLSDDEKDSVRETMEAYHRFRINDSWVPIEAEVVKGRLLYEDDEIRLLWKAKLDLYADTDQGLRAVDHKTMSQRRETTNLNNQFTGQCLVTGTQTMFVNKIGFQTSLKPEQRFERVPVNYSFDRLLEWRTVILPYWAKMYLMYAEGNYFPPNFTNCETKYGFCEYRIVCEGDRNDRERILGQHFIVGKPWDINNLVTGGDE